MLSLNLENGIIYKSINTPLFKKVMTYVTIDDQLVNSGEYNKEINSIEELRVFAEENEKSFS